MRTRKCSKCGWEFSENYSHMVCKFCHGLMLTGYCKECGEWSEKLFYGKICHKCYADYRRGLDHARVDRQRETFEEWCAIIAKLPAKPLTEQQWLEACEHFNGCAYCGNPEIAARSMFIDFQDGGRYCDWNIIPACEQCATAIKVEPNPFIRMDRTKRRGKANQARRLGFSLENLQRIVDYLQSKMEVQSDC